MSPIKDDPMNPTLTPEELAMLNTPAREAVRFPKSTPLTTESVEGPHPSLELLHRDFATSLATTLAALARREVVVRLREQSLATYSQFVFGQSVPTCCAIVRSDPIEFYLVLQPSILYPILDRMLGCPQSDAIPSRPLTEIERALTGLILQPILSKYAEAWLQPFAADFEVDRIEHNVQQLGALNGSERTYRARYSVRCTSDHGIVEICLPWNATHQVRQRLAASR